MPGSDVLEKCFMLVMFLNELRELYNKFNSISFYNNAVSSEEHVHLTNEITCLEELVAVTRDAILNIHTADSFLATSTVDYSTRDVQLFHIVEQYGTENADDREKLAGALEEACRSH